jgi:hypothetical protein
VTDVEYHRPLAVFTNTKFQNDSNERTMFFIFSQVHYERTDGDRRDAREIRLRNMFMLDPFEDFDEIAS